MKVADEQAMAQNARRNTLRHKQGSQGAVTVLEREDALEQTTACIG